METYESEGEDMKLAVAVAGENALPSAFVVWRGFENSIRKASEYGYDGIELALKSAEDIKVEDLSKWLDRWGIEVSCISTGQVFAASGLYFTHPKQEVRDEAVRVFKGLINLAKDFGKIVNVGRVRGFIDVNQGFDLAQKLFIDTTERVCDEAEKYGVELIIEPVNRYEANFINNLDEGAELISKLKRKNLGLMPDIFHMNIEDNRISESLVRNSKHIKYVHLADSNRLAPGQGHIDFQEIFDVLYKINFDGWSSIEILPKPNADIAARQAVQFILPMIKEYNKKLKGGGL